MIYNSTRNNEAKVSASQAIVKGISEEGGLFVPGEFPTVDMQNLIALKDKSYAERGKYILGKFLTDFTTQELDYCVDNAYLAEKFSSSHIAELVHIYEGRYILELWHGPTCAFKDIALQLLPYLLTTSAKKVLSDKEIAILVATSGDTGKAALEGFKDVEGTKILVFYPEDGVSNIQKLQMVTQEGGNVTVCAIEGNFDDAQTGVKKVFTDPDVTENLNEKGIVLSSANSINWGRLVPQIVYYFSAYCDLLNNSEINAGDRVNIVVPTGNFGNILSAYYAKKMGLPVNRFICASNSNNVLTDFINTGVYDRNRPFFITDSPSMDILISSNLERLIYDLYDCDDKAISRLFEELADTGRYEVSEEVKQKMSDHFYGGFCDDNQTKNTIKEMFDKYSYLCDTHTAVAVKVYEDYRNETGDNTKTIIASTASPYKFTKSVLEAIGGNTNAGDFEQIKELEKKSGTIAPKQLVELDGKKARFSDSISKDDMERAILYSLGVK